MSLIIRYSHRVCDSIPGLKCISEIPYNSFKIEGRQVFQHTKEPHTTSRIYECLLRKIKFED